MKHNISLFSVTPETGGIFSALDSYDVPWKSSVDSDLLDLEYYGNISGQKAISPLVRKNLFYGVLTEAKQQTLANLIFSMYGPYWAKEWATLSKQYDPIANYDMTEIMEDDETVIEYGKTEDTTTGNTHTKTGTETDTPAVSVTTDDSVYGFNSSDDVPSNKRQETPSGTDETEYDLSETDSGSVGLEQGGSDTHTRNYTLTRKGNIGVTTSQQLLQAERDLWMWNFFLKVVFPNVDSVLTIPVYVDEDEEAEKPDRPEGTIQIVQNGTVSVLDYEYANVNVPNSYGAEDQGKVVYGDLLLQQTSREVVNNGVYDTTLNNQVTVDVPNSYTQEDEGKVVDNGSLVSQTSRTITENGEYDTTTNNICIVDAAPVFPDGFITGQVDLIAQKANSTSFNVGLIKYNISSDRESYAQYMLSNGQSVISMEDFINTLKLGIFYNGEIYNSADSDIVNNCGMVLLGNFSSGGSASGNVLLDDFTKYDIIVLQGVYSSGNPLSSNYNLCTLYRNVVKDTPYWCGMRDRNGSYKCNVTFTDETHVSLSDVRRCMIYGIE